MYPWYFQEEVGSNEQDTGLHNWIAGSIPALISTGAIYNKAVLGFTFLTLLVNSPQASVEFPVLFLCSSCAAISTAILNTMASI